MRYLLLNPTWQYAASSTCTYPGTYPNVKTSKSIKFGNKAFVMIFAFESYKKEISIWKKKHIHKCRCEIWKEMFCSEVTATLGLKCLRKALWPQLWILCSSRLTSWLGMWWRGYCHRSLRQIIEEQRIVISLRHRNSWNSGSACSLMFAEFFNKHNLINPHNNLERKRNPST